MTNEPKIDRKEAWKWGINIDKKSGLAIAPGMIPVAGKRPESDTTGWGPHGSIWTTD